MENYQLITVVGANLLVFLSFMSTVIALHIHGNKQTRDFQTAMYNETKDFHKRLCEIESGKSK